MRLTASGLVLLTLAACTSPVTLTLAPAGVRDPGALAPSVSRAREGQTDATPRRHVVRIGLVEDARPAGAGTGAVAGRVLDVPAVVEQLRHALGRLSGPSFTATTDEPAPGPAPAVPVWTLHARIRQCYGSSLDITKSFNLVLELELRGPDDEPVRRVVRGRITHVNWWNSSAEIQEAARLALEAALREATGFLETHTASAGPARLPAASE